MTWGDFKQRVEALGVSDADELAYIDWAAARSVNVVGYVEVGVFRFVIGGATVIAIDDSDSRLDQEPA